MPARRSALLLASCLFLLPSLAQAGNRHHQSHRRAHLARSWGHPSWFRGMLPVPVVRGEGTPPPVRRVVPAQPTLAPHPLLAQRLAQSPVVREITLARQQWDRFNGMN